MEGEFKKSENIEVREVKEFSPTQTPKGWNLKCAGHAVGLRGASPKGAVLAGIL